MAQKKLRVVHYLNQFFGQIGGEEKATTGFMVKEGPVGLVWLFKKSWVTGLKLLPQSSVVTTISQSIPSSAQRKD